MGMPNSVENMNTQYPDSEAQTRLNEIMENAELMMENFKYLTNLLQKSSKMEEKSIESDWRDGEIEDEEKTGDEEATGDEEETGNEGITAPDIEMGDEDEIDMRGTEKT